MHLVQPMQAASSITATCGERLARSANSSFVFAALASVDFQRIGESKRISYEQPAPVGKGSYRPRTLKHTSFAESRQRILNRDLLGYRADYLF